MAPDLPNATLERLSAFVTREMGLFFPKERWNELERGIASALRALGCQDSLADVERLLARALSRRELETIAEFLTVGETYFLREPRTLEVFQKEILPELLRARRGGERRLRIWSAGCSSGEEPYSIAILLRRMLPDLAQWQVTILATDINAASLRKGMAGVYRAWSFRASPSWFRDLYFRPVGAGLYEIDPRIKRMVSFAYLNLAEEGYPSLASNTNAMDVIFCRNVLMYFAPQLAQAVVGRLHRSLMEKGWLIVSPAEISPTLYASFEAVHCADSSLYRKGGASPRPATAGAALPAAAPAAAPRQPAGAAAEPAQSRYELAAKLYRQGRYPEACTLLTEPYPPGNEDLAALSLLVRSYANQGELAQAQRWCDQALKADRLDPELHCLRAEILQEQGETGEARASLERALFLDPTLAIAHLSLGYLALWEGRGNTAGKHFENALRLISSVADDALLPGTEGMTAGRLREIVLRMTLSTGGGGRGEGGRS